MRPNAGTLLERVHRVQQRGIDVWCGMIVGFDHDDPSIFDVMPKFLAEARISAALIGMLHAIPTTPLYDRLKKEGRLNDDEASDKYGTNVIPLGMSREELRDGFVQVMQSCYRPTLTFSASMPNSSTRISSSPCISFPIGRAIAGPGRSDRFLNYCRFACRHFAPAAPGERTRRFGRDIGSSCCACFASAGASRTSCSSTRSKSRHIITMPRSRVPWRRSRTAAASCPMRVAPSRA